MRFTGRLEGDLGLTAGEPSAQVAASRAALVAACGVRGISAGRQVHGADVAVVREEPSGYEIAGEADGRVTALRGVAVAVHVADCLPIAVAGEGGVAMLHGGWRGLAAGVIEEGVAALRSLGVAGPLAAAIGPGAGGCCYEAGEEVHAAFGGRVSNGRLVDLKAEARLRLEEAGVATVHDAGRCTLCAAPGQLFSHRRGDGGRQAGIAWLLR